MTPIDTVQFMLHLPSMQVSLSLTVDEVMGVILGTTSDTPIDTVQFKLHLPSTQVSMSLTMDEVMGVILGTTSDTPTDTVQFMLHLPSMQVARQKVEQVNAYFSAVENHHNP